MAELLGFFVDEAGRARPFSAWWGQPWLAEVSVVGNNVIAVLAGGVERAEVENIVATLHPDRGGEWDALRAATIGMGPQDILSEEADQPFVAVGGGRWMAASGP